jgi:hypothetical protein
MNRIKSYKLFESNFIDTISIIDILQEIMDIGYNVQVQNGWDSQVSEYNHVKVFIRKRPDYNYVDEIKETIDRLINFLGNNNYELTKDSKLYYNNLMLPIRDTKEEMVVRRWGLESIEFEWQEDIRKYGIWNDIELYFRIKNLGI